MCVKSEGGGGGGEGRERRGKGRANVGTVIILEVVRSIQNVPMASLFSLFAHRQLHLLLFSAFFFRTTLCGSVSNCTCWMVKQVSITSSVSKSMLLSMTVHVSMPALLLNKPRGCHLQLMKDVLREFFSYITTLFPGAEKVIRFR